MTARAIIPLHKIAQNFDFGRLPAVERSNVFLEAQQHCTSWEVKAYRLRFFWSNFELAALGPALPGSVACLEFHGSAKARKLLFLTDATPEPQHTVDSGDETPDVPTPKP